MKGCVACGTFYREECVVFRVAYLWQLSQDLIIIILSIILHIVPEYCMKQVIGHPRCYQDAYIIVFSTFLPRRRRRGRIRKCIWHLTIIALTGRQHWLKPLPILCFISEFLNFA